MHSWNVSQALSVTPSASRRDCARILQALISKSAYRFREEINMSSVGRVTEITARSSKSFEEAVDLGIARANKTLRNVTSAWVKEQRCEVREGKITAYQVNLLVTFILED